MSMDIVMDGKDVLIADAATNSIRRLVPDKEVTTIDWKDTLSTPHGIAVDEAGIIYIADMGTNRILEINKNGMVTSIAGTGEQGCQLIELNKPAAVLVHAGHLWIADLNNHQIKVLPLNK